MTLNLWIKKGDCVRISTLFSQKRGFHTCMNMLISEREIYPALNPDRNQIMSEIIISIDLKIVELTNK